MAAIRQNVHELVVSSGKCLFVFRNGEKERLEIPDASLVENKDKRKKDDGEDGLQKSNKNWILASAFSKSGCFFAVCDDQKQLHVYRTSPKWELLSSRQVQRRSTAVTFTSSETDVIVADRAGDVYRYSVEDSGKEGELLQGHLSMLLDVILTKDDRYIVTCDRDEKIRISHYPNAYNIHTFCLKHTEFVSQLMYIEKYDCLLSGSGDGRICAWKLGGKLMLCVCCTRKLCHTPAQVLTSTNGEGDQTVKGHLPDTQVQRSTNGEGEPEAKGQGHSCEDQDAAAVKRMVYSDHLDILAVLFFNSFSISFFNLSQTDSKVQLQELDHTIDTSSDREFWDISFDSEHRLWLLQACETTPVHVFRCSVSAHQLQLTSASKDEDILGIVNTLNSSWTFFSESLSAPSLYSVLQKTKVDNMKEYMERKNERMGGKKLKQDSLKDRESEPEEKKTKVS